MAEENEAKEPNDELATKRAARELETKIEKWREEYGEVAVFRPPGFPVCVFRAPRPEILEPCLDEISRDKGKKAAAFRSLANQSLLHPTLDELKIVWKRFAGLPLKVGATLVEISGTNLEADEKKV